MVTSTHTIGNYEILAKVAEGAVGAVYKARHPESGKIVAIKIIPPALAADEILLKRFEQEFLAAVRLDHPNVVRALGFGQDGQRHYLVMEYVEGESLGQRLKRNGRLPESLAVRLVVQVARGLQAAHEMGLIHRDIKPDNILLTEDGQAKLTDFGIVKEQGADLCLTGSRSALGTPQFMAPEQFDDAKSADIRSEVYALGATLYAAVTGELPFHARSHLTILKKKVNNELMPPRDLAPDLSEAIERAIVRAVQADPNLRPQSCVEFINELISPSREVHRPSPSVQLMPAPGVSGSISRAETRDSPRRRAKGTARYRACGESTFSPPSASPGGSGRPAKAILVNLSEGGVHMLVQERFDVGDVVEVELSAPGGRGSLLGGDPIRMLHEAEVRWIEAGHNDFFFHIGCRWKARIDFTELKRFI